MKVVIKSQQKKSKRRKNKNNCKYSPKTINKMITRPTITIINYFKYKWAKFSIQKTKWLND